MRPRRLIGSFAKTLAIFAAGAFVLRIGSLLLSDEQKTSAFLWLYTAVLLGPPAVTVFIPRRWLWAWVPANVAWWILLTNLLSGAGDGPGAFGAYVAIGLITLLGGSVLLLRLLIEGFVALTPSNDYSSRD